MSEGGAEPDRPAGGDHRIADVAEQADSLAPSLKQ
jgi:hypothetical protein